MTSITILRKPGFILNPNDKTVNSIFRLLSKNNGHCPCNNPEKAPMTIYVRVAVTEKIIIAAAHCTYRVHNRSDILW